jgi:hypothetical protein
MQSRARARASEARSGAASARKRNGKGGSRAGDTRGYKAVRKPVPVANHYVRCLNGAGARSKLGC